METNPFTTIELQLNEIKLQNQQILSAINKQPADAAQVQLIESLPDRLRSRDIKKLFNISSVTVWKWTTRRLLNPQVINGRNYFSKKEVLVLLNEKSK